MSMKFAVGIWHFQKSTLEKERRSSIEEHHDSITYDDVAIPEVHIPVRKRNEKKEPGDVLTQNSCF